MAMALPSTWMRKLWAGLAAGALVLGGACGGGDEPKPAAAASTTTEAVVNPPAPVVDTTDVTVKGFRFDPQVARVKAGSVVTWTNEDPSDDHAIQDDAAGLKGPDFGPNADKKTYARTYETPGTYPYFCKIHNSMSGTIIVT